MALAIGKSAGVEIVRRTMMVPIFAKGIVKALRYPTLAQLKLIFPDSVME